MSPVTSQETINNPTDLYKYDGGIQFDLPGYGQPRSDCGNWIYIGHIPVPGKIHYLRRKKSCHRKECPVCWPDWQKREALSISDRIGYYCNMYKRQPVHYVISPPQSVKYTTKADFRILRSKAYKIGKLRGIKGGVMIFHERAKRYQANSDTYTKAHCSDGPHFHVIGDGWLSERVKEFYLEDGWIVKNLRIRKTSHVYKTAFYILDHAAIGHGYPAISHSDSHALASATWFGSMGYSKLHIEKFHGSDTIYCPVCDHDIASIDWYVLTWLGLKDPPNGQYGESEESKTGFICLNPITLWSGFS